MNVERRLYNPTLFNFDTYIILPVDSTFVFVIIILPSQRAPTTVKAAEGHLFRTNDAFQLDPGERPWTAKLERPEQTQGAEGEISGVHECARRVKGEMPKATAGKSLSDLYKSTQLLVSEYWQ
ncbi:hypothetical protein P691DRAFT_812191 [Macrolepiota fuliginosa MF-IS2]|uniref:Uncharacterized protein n=1 Tax=Macrolepiota fuliginosa MF-IS2 TaxID=1400762 RepID=A0A9P5WZF3_9AGAR|nr:hypothetical protein P691DRAFT_812191 [Macrolepiota fuliginosa MF-IS2]